MSGPMMVPEESAVCINPMPQPMRLSGSEEEAMDMHAGTKPATMPHKIRTPISWYTFWHTPVRK